MTCDANGITILRHEHMQRCTASKALAPHHKRLQNCQKLRQAMLPHNVKLYITTQAGTASSFHLYPFFRAGQASQMTAFALVRLLTSALVRSHVHPFISERVDFPD